jgi:hypothetical protein
MAKFRASRPTAWAASEAVQIHRGFGCVLDGPVARFYCDALSAIRDATQAGAQGFAPGWRTQIVQNVTSVPVSFLMTPVERRQTFILTVWPTGVFALVLDVTEPTILNATASAGHPVLGFVAVAV